MPYREVPLWLELVVEQVEGEPLGAGGILGLGDLVEESGGLVDAVLADVDVVLDGPVRPAPAEGGRVQHPALLPDGVQGQHLVDGNTEHLVPEELARRLVKRLVRTEVVVAERELGASRIRPQTLDPVGRKSKLVRCGL